MKVVADESVDFGIIQHLRNYNIVVFSILEQCHGITDERVLEIAFKDDSILLTEDKDFGELTHRLKLNHCGIVLIRLFDLPRNQRIEFATQLILNHFELLQHKFSVIDKPGVRIKETRAK